MTILGWKAWNEYSVFDGRDTRPGDLPNRLQAVVVFREGGKKEILTGARSDEDKWYVFFPNQRVVADEGIYIEVREKHREAVGNPKKGTWTSDENYARIIREAREAVWSPDAP